MTAPGDHAGGPADLRRRAEDKARGEAARPPETPVAPSSAEERQLIHELQVHQIELEMQNDELRRTQEELEASRARYFDLYDLAPVGYCTLSAQGLILEANLTAAAMLGVARGALLKQSLARFVFPEDQGHYSRHREKLLATAAPQGCELRLQCAPGAPFWARIESTMTRAAGSDSPAWRAALIDVGALKRTEKALRDHERELTEKNAVLERFTSAASHDLKSPLNTISVFLDFVERDAREQDAEAIENDMKAIRTAASTMDRLLAELSDLLRVGYTTNPTVRAPLREVVREALALVAGSVARRGVEIVVTGEPVVLNGDRPRLVEVFQNLVDNAVKFMGDQKAPRVEIGVERAGDETVFFVRDNGIGIEPRDQPKIFDLFEKIDPGSKGTGLGLVLVKRIVEAHGGRIWVASEGEDKGTIFRFTLTR